MTTVVPAGAGAGQYGPDGPAGSGRAAQRAQAVVGRYGDPETAWSVLLGAELSAPVDPALVVARLAELCRRYPHLGAAPTLTLAPSAEAVRGAFASTAYTARDPLIRVAMGTQRSDLLIAAHHGAVDGLGMVALLGAALDRPARTDALGLGDRPARRSFAASAVRRVGEALFTPPTRLHRSPDRAAGPTAGAQDRDEVLIKVVLPRYAVGTAAMVAAASAVTVWWNREHGVPYERIVAGIGASRRGGGAPRPEHRALFIRMTVPPGGDREQARALMAAQAPEPDYPAGGGLSRLAVHLLANRLGATFLVSNLGVLDAGGLVRSAAFYPVASGPAGVAFGGVSTASTTTLTVRTRRRDFSPAAAAALLDGLIVALPTPDPARFRPPAAG